MAIPDYQSIMLPILRHAGDGKEHSLRDTINDLAGEFGLSDQERDDLLPSGLQSTWDNRVGWARTYLKKAGLLQATKRGYAQITERGRQVLKENPERIDAAYLKRFPGFVEFISPNDSSNEPPTADTETPEEVIESEARRLRNALAEELLETIKRQLPAFFERLVIDLLVSMGYGGTRRDAGQAVGRSGDGGIDGYIREDRLGLDMIYVQAKRWEASVGSPHIMAFAGALAGQKAKKGVFITTSSFSQQAREYADKIDTRIVLIDGQALAELMIDHGIGVVTKNTYEVKELDAGYFAED